MVLEITQVPYDAMIFAATVLFGELDTDGEPKGLMKLGNNIQFMFSMSSTNETIIGRTLEDDGSTIAGIAKREETTLTIGANTMSPETLAAINMGTSQEIDKTGASVTLESHKGYLGRLIQLDNRNISNVVIKDSTEVTTYVLDTDYKIYSAELALIEILPGGSIVDAEELLHDYDFLGETGYSIEAGTKITHRWWLVFLGQNKENEKMTVITVFDSNIATNGDLDFLAENHLAWAMTGPISKPAGRTHPYKLEHRLATAA